MCHANKNAHMSKDGVLDFVDETKSKMKFSTSCTLHIRRTGMFNEAQSILRFLILGEFLLTLWFSDT